MRNRLVLVIVGCILIYACFLLGLGYAWYAKQWVSGFHFFNDGPEWKQLDKFAHCFWTFQASLLATRLFTWAGADPRKGGMIGAAIGFSFVTLIEIPDGFSEAYGASVLDIVANACGALLFLGQRLVFSKLVVIPKFSFHPTSFAPLRPVMLGDGLLEEILKDYNGQTFWYSIRIPWLRLPSWLVVAVGVGAEGMIYGRDFQNEAVGLHPYRKYFLSIDLDLSEVRPANAWMNALLHVFRIIKIPAPAIEFSTHGIRFHPIYF